MTPTRLRTALAVYLSVMIPYGIANMANDGWNEQIVERGWASWTVPDMLRPGLNWAWGVTILAAAATFFALDRGVLREEDRSATGPPRSRLRPSAQSLAARKGARWSFWRR